MTERTQIRNSALFVGQVLWDRVVRVDHVPVDDEKVTAIEAVDRAGGNAFVAALACAQVGFIPDVISGIGNDVPGQMIEGSLKSRGAFWHPRLMEKTPCATILVNPRGRAIISPPDKERNEYLQDFPLLDIEGCRIVHIDGTQFDAAEHYVREAVRLGVPVSCDFGRARPGIKDLLPHIVFPGLSERCAKELYGGVDNALEELRKHSLEGVVTLGSEGLRFFKGKEPIRHLPAPRIPAELVVDTNGAGDVFHGARVAAYLQWPDKALEYRLWFASCAAGSKIQHFDDYLPDREDVHLTMRHCGVRAVG